MAIVPVPKDLNHVKTKIMFNLTKRQIICFSLAGIIGIPTYLISKPALGVTAAALLMSAVILPILFFALYEKDGLPAEKILKHMVSYTFLQDKVRPYRTENEYITQKNLNETEEA